MSTRARNLCHFSWGQWSKPDTGPLSQSLNMTWVGGISPPPPPRPRLRTTLHTVCSLAGSKNLMLIQRYPPPVQGLLWNGYREIGFKTGRGTLHQTLYGRVLSRRRGSNKSKLYPNTNHNPSTYHNDIGSCPTFQICNIIKKNKHFFFDADPYKQLVLFWKSTVLKTRRDCRLTVLIWKP